MSIQTHSKPGPDRVQLKSHSQHQPADADTEALWQQLMVFNHALHETLDAMEQERISQAPPRIQQHWQGFIQALQQRKPNLSQQLDQLLGAQKQGGAP